VRVSAASGVPWWWHHTYFGTALVYSLDGKDRFERYFRVINLSKGPLKIAETEGNARKIDVCRKNTTCLYSCRVKVAFPTSSILPFRPHADLSRSGGQDTPPD